MNERPIIMKDMLENTLRLFLLLLLIIGAAFINSAIAESDHAGQQESISSHPATLALRTNHE